jgi:hypothetical protein
MGQCCGYNLRAVTKFIPVNSSGNVSGIVDKNVLFSDLTNKYNYILN